MNYPPQRTGKMFKVVAKLSVNIDGCPPDGVEAVDFRVANGLRPFPNSGVKVQVEIQSERICRKYADYLDSDANLVLDRATPMIATVNRMQLSAPVELLAPFDNWESTPTTEAHVEALVDYLAGKVATIEKDQLRWIAQHGSERLRRLVDEDIEYYGVYFSERIEFERPGWVESRTLDGEYKEPRNPPEYALSLLDEGRAVDPDCRLVYWYIAAEPIGREKYEWSGYAAVGEFLGREVVLMEGDAE